jgi:dUTP pyrophosphatase
MLPEVSVTETASAAETVRVAEILPAAETVPVAVRLIDPDLPPPAYAHSGDAGADLVAAEDAEIPPGERVLVRTGVSIALPDGYVGLVHPRSGLAARLGVTVLNAPGTVDAGYRGEILVNLVNHDRVTSAKISRGDRIAQLVVQRVGRAHFHVVDRLPDSARGTSGHGSTGGMAQGSATPGSGTPRAEEER